MTALYGGYIGSLSWFDNKSTIPQDYNGESANAFFGGGDGTSTSPYKIMTPRHFYNLCWLQYIGRFNKDTDNDGIINQVYFSLENDIDCSTLGSALPPIGTTRYPFVGNFTGNDHIISNYTITDEYAKLIKHPSIIDTESTYYSQGSKTINYCSIIGTFGVIGYNTTGAFDVLDTEASLYGFSSDQLKVNTVSNLYIDNVTIKPTTTNTLAGLLAGYVSANMSSCGVHYSKLDFSNGNTNIDSSKFNGKLSNYSLIGDYNSTDYEWDGHSGQNNDFGGSIDFASISKRLTYIIDNYDSTTSDSSGKTFKSDIFNSYLYIRSNQSLNPSDYSWDAFNTGSTSMQTVFLAEGTYIPLNIDEATATIDGKATTMGSYYNMKQSEPVLNTNTGYLVGADSSTGATPRIQHRAGNASSGIPYSIASQDRNENLTDSTVFDSSNISFFYVDSTANSPSTKRIIDNDYIDKLYKTYTNANDQIKLANLNFQNYSSVKSSFISSLRSATSSSVLSDGRITLNAVLFNKSSKAQKTITKSSVKIKDSSKVSTYDKYALLTGGLNFSLSKSGIMTFISANMTGSNTATLPPLLKLERSSDKSSFASKKQIYKIYKNGSSYAYTYNNSDTISGGNLIVDLYKLTQGDGSSGLFKRNCAYYMEIPLLPGDYYFGADTSGSSYTYFLYLDIGANAGDSGEDEKKGTLENIDFYYYENNALVRVTSDNESQVVFDISGDGTAVFYFNRILNIGVLYYDKNVNNLTRTQPSTFTGASYEASDQYCTSKKSI